MTDSSRSQPAALTDGERAEILALAADLPAVWAAPTTTPVDRQARDPLMCSIER